VRRGVLSALALAVSVTALAVSWSVGREAPARPEPPPAPDPSPAVTATPDPALDPAQLRDIFRFGDEESRAREAAPPAAAPPRLETPPPGPRLVGLVRRGGRLLAAFAVDGEVLLVGEGDSLRDAIVLRVTDESVRVRTAEGEERDLPLP
jgi:hypothetical protein